MMSQRICKNCLESFDSNGVSWYCSECGESKRQLPESVRVARANRARKICSVCGKKFGMSDAGIDPSVAAERRAGMAGPVVGHRTVTRRAIGSW